MAERDAMSPSDETKALVKILEMGEAEIKAGQFRDVDDFLTEFEQDDALGEQSED